jgi:hypothetical protein
MKLDDHETRRRKATSAVIDMVCCRWPAQWHLRAEGDLMQELRKARNALPEGDEQDRLTEAITASCERMCEILDVLERQMP